MTDLVAKGDPNVNNDKKDDDKDKKERKDELFESAEVGIRKTVDNLVKIHSTVGLFDYIGKLIEKEKELGKSQRFTIVPSRNRKQGYGCTDGTRVRLKNMDETKDYINANFIECGPSERRFIATQHPLENHYDDFWRMIYQETVDIVIAIFEPSVELPIYFPIEAGQFFNHGDYFVNCKKVEKFNLNNATMYTIEVVESGCADGVLFNLIHYSNWPNEQLVEYKTLLKLIRTIQSPSKVTNGPCVVHCSDGLQQTGCLILTDYITDLMFKNVEVDISQVIKKLQSQRSMFITNKIYCVFAVCTALTYVRIRLSRYGMAKDLKTQIDGFLKTFEKEFRAITAKKNEKVSKRENVIDQTSTITSLSK